MSLLAKPGSLTLLVTFVIMILYSMYRVMNGWIPKLRPIAAIEAMDEGVARAAEMGGKVHFTTGAGSLYSSSAMRILGGISILNYVAGLCAKYNVPLVHTFGQGEVAPISEELMKNAGESAGRPDWYQPDYVRFLAPDQYALTSAIMGILQREKITTHMCIGSFGGNSLLLGEAGSLAGCLTYSGTPNIKQIPMMITAYDYCLVGEEMYAASASIAEERIQLGAIAGQDLAKYLSIILILGGVVLSLFGFDIGQLFK